MEAFKSSVPLTTFSRCLLWQDFCCLALFILDPVFYVYVSELIISFSLQHWLPNKVNSERRKIFHTLLCCVLAFRTHTKGRSFVNMNYADNNKKLRKLLLTNNTNWGGGSVTDSCSSATFSFFHAACPIRLQLISAQDSWERWH